MVSLWRPLTLLLLWVAVVPPLTAAVEVTIDRNPVQVNESFQLVFSVDQNPRREPDFSVLQQHFLVLGNNRSNSISINMAAADQCSRTSISSWIITNGITPR